MLIEKDTIKCESIFNDERTHRYLCKRVWDKTKPLVAVLMLNPCHADNIMNDSTTTYVVNNVASLEKYGGVVIVNLYSKLTAKLNFRWNGDEDLNHKDNDTYIVKAAEECDTVILAWGRGADTHKRITARANDVLELLKTYAEKLMIISDGERDGLHPLTPSIRSKWQLKPYKFEDQAVQKEKSVNEEKTVKEENNVPV